MELTTWPILQLSVTLSAYIPGPSGRYVDVGRLRLGDPESGQFGWIALLAY